MAEGSLRRRGILAAVAVLAGAIVAFMGLVTSPPGPDVAWVGVAAVIWILAVAAVSPIVGSPVLRAARAVFGRLFGPAGRLAGENALRNPRRTGATASALMIGLALVSAIGVLAASMNASASKVVDEQFNADYLVQSVGFQGFTTQIGDEIARVDGVSDVERQQWVQGLVKKSPQYVSALTPGYLDIYDLKATAGSTRLDDSSLLLSTDKASELGLGIGDDFTLNLSGNRTLTAKVSGIFEPTPVTAAIVAPMQALERAGVQRQDSDLSVLAADGVDQTALKKRLDKVVQPYPIVTVQDKQDFSDTIRSQINTLLYMIYGLLALAIIIAVIGIVNTLGLSVIERTREIGLLRAIGLSRSRLRRMIMLESVAIALLGAILGLGLGLVIGVLVQRTLADDLDVLSLPLGQLGLFLVIAVIVGVLAAIIPAIRASRMRVLQAIATQ